MKKLLVIGLCVFSVTGFAEYKKEVTGGLRFNKSSVSGASSKDRLDFQGGLLVFIPMTPVVSFRTGGLLVMRHAEIEVSGTTLTASRMFIDAPATFAFEVSRGIVPYAGFDVGLKFMSSCGGCTFRDEKSLVLQPLFGIDVAFNYYLKGGFFYELETEYSSNWKQSAFGFTANYNF